MMRRAVDGVWGRGLFDNEFRPHGGDVHRCAEFVGDAGRQAAHRRQPLRVPQLLERSKPGLGLFVRLVAHSGELLAHRVECGGQL